MSNYRSCQQAAVVPAGPQHVHVPSAQAPRRQGAQGEKPLRSRTNSPKEQQKYQTDANCTVGRARDRLAVYMPRAPTLPVSQHYIPDPLPSAHAPRSSSLSLTQRAESSKPAVAFTRRLASHVTPPPRFPPRPTGRVGQTTGLFTPSSSRRRDRGLGRGLTRVGVQG